VLKFGEFRPVKPASVWEPGVTTSIETVHLNPPSTALLAYLDYTPHRPPVMNALVGPIVAALPLTEQLVGVADGCTPDMDDALYLLTLGTEENDWRLLYLAYEIIEDHVGQPSKIQRLGWASLEEIKRFKDTANSRSLLGNEARHGRRSPTPKHPMNPREAQRLIQQLLLAWLRSQAERAG
jgi:hypothetical protein